MINRWTSELIGMPLLKSIASEQLEKNPSKKDRIWSSEFESWGFFDSNITMFDEFLLWSLISPGDRITLDPPDQVFNFFIVVDIKRDDSIKESPIWIFKLLGQNPRFLEIKVKEKQLFFEAVKYF